MARRHPPTGRHTVKTNKEPDSKVELKITPITFQQLWDNYVTGKPYDDPQGTHSNQCAIRLSATLHKVGVDMKSFSQNNVKPMPGKASLGRILLNGKATATRAYEMAEWLKLMPFAGLSRPVDITGPDWLERARGRTGIIFFFGYWQQSGDSGSDLTGGHIDLWNGERMPNNGIRGAFQNFVRFRLRVPSLGGWLFSDLGNSRKILIFEVK